MATRQYRTLSKRIVDRLAVDDKDAVFWDRELPGFGLRVYPSGAKVYVVQTRCAGRSKRVTVGRHGDVSPDQARKEAARIIARIKAGEAPIPAPPQGRAHDGGACRALPARTRRDALQAGDRGPLPHHARQAHRARPEGTQGGGGGAQAHPGVSVRAAREADGGKPSNRDAGQDVQLGRSVGTAPFQHQPVPIRAPVQSAGPARTVPHARGTPTARASP